jgi:hypothetical protein
LPILVAVPAVLNAMQGIFWFSTKVLAFFTPSSGIAERSRATDTTN